MSVWKFTKKKKGYEITKQDGKAESYSLGIASRSLLNSLVTISHNFQEGDIIDTGNVKEDLVFWDEDFEAFVLLKEGHTNNSVWFPKLVAGECN